MKTIPTKGRPWLEALKSLEVEAKKDETSRTNTALSPVDDNFRIPSPTRCQKCQKSNSFTRRRENPRCEDHARQTQRGAAYARNYSRATSWCRSKSKGRGPSSLDLETTGLSPRKNSIRLLSLAAKDATYIVDCQTVDPARLFPILGESTLVAHNALFDGPDVVPKISLATSSCGPRGVHVIAATMP